MAGDCFMWIKESNGTFEGESQDNTCEKWVELHSFSFSASQAVGASQSTAGARTGERTDISDLSISKDTDKTSPQLFSWCVTGEHLEKIVIRNYRSVGGAGLDSGGKETGKQCYEVIELHDALITSFSQSGGAGVPMESVTFNPGAIVVNYIPTNHVTGAKEAAIPKSWSTVNNVADSDTDNVDDGDGAVS